VTQKLHIVIKILKAILVGVYIAVIVKRQVTVSGHIGPGLPHLKLANVPTLMDISVLIA